MEEKVYKVTVTLTNFSYSSITSFVYRIAAKDEASAAQIAAEDYIWGEDALTDIEVTLAEEE